MSSRTEGSSLCVFEWILLVTNITPGQTPGFSCSYRRACRAPFLTCRVHDRDRVSGQALRHPLWLAIASEEYFVPNVGNKSILP